MTTTREAGLPFSSAGVGERELDRLLDPARFYRHPQDVVRDEGLDASEKRAILSSWASDACAVASTPTLRKPPGLAAPVPFDAIMAALQALDRQLSRGPFKAAPQSTRRLASLQH
jgi:hypothetical protein